MPCCKKEENDDEVEEVIRMDGQDYVLSNEKKSQRKRWFVEKILRELPIIGGLFDSYTKKCRAKLSAVGKSVCELAAGGIAMALVPVALEESTELRMAKLVTTMTVGMAAGNMVYNTVSSANDGMTTFYHCCLKRLATHRNKQQQNDLGDVYTATTSALSMRGAGDS
jgi:hypothetical protein